MARRQTSGATRSFLAKQDPVKAVKVRKRQDCSVAVHFDSTEMRDAFFAWLTGDGMAHHVLPELRDATGARGRLAVDQEAPDKVFVMDPDVDESSPSATGARA